jgi:hypothetical protein
MEHFALTRLANLFGSLWSGDSERRTSKGSTFGSDGQSFEGMSWKQMLKEKLKGCPDYDTEPSRRIDVVLLALTLRRMADKPKDTVYIFLAGHTAPEKDPQSKDSDGITKYILHMIPIRKIFTQPQCPWMKLLEY